MHARSADVVHTKKAIYFIIVFIQNMDMVSGDAPERPVMNSVIKAR